MSDAALLTLVQWLSPAFPVGGYAYSQGLEWAISAGDVHSADSLADWLAAVLAFGTLRSDAIFLALCLQPGADLAGLSDLARAAAPSRERLAETMEQGRAFALATNALTGCNLAASPYPVAVGGAARGLGLDPARVVALFLQAVIGNLVQVAVRFVPLGQTEGQRVVAGLLPEIQRVAAEALAATLADIGGAAVRADLAGMAHETMEVRIYRT